MSLDLPTDLQQFVAHELELGRYSSEAELSTDAVRRLRDDEVERERFKAQLQERIARIERGEGIVVEGNEALRNLLDDMMAKVDRELAARQVQQQ
jgi:Arc/MetJ-type ribon-helix-helix transcriptional regulator